MDNHQHLVINTDDQMQNGKGINDNTPFIHAGHCENKININNKKSSDVKMNSLVEETTACSINIGKSNGHDLVQKTETVQSPKNQTLDKDLRDINDVTEIMSSTTSTETEDQENQQYETNEDDANKTCTVCGGTANGVYFGALVCLPCKSFYIRSTKDGEPNFTCNCKNGSDKTKQGRTKCQHCRYQQCLTAGMCRKEKPELVQITEGQKLCKVCGDIANGIHFGIDTCEGCKKFFRRGVTENKSYVCKGQKNCSINPRNRNNCRYCRYVKCINAGMSRDAIKMGRPKKQSEHPENIKNAEAENSHIDIKKSPGQEDTLNSTTSPDVAKHCPCNIARKCNVKAPFNSAILNNSRLSSLLTRVDESRFRKDAQPDPYSLNTPISCGTFVPEYKIPSSMNGDSNLNEQGMNTRVDLKIEQPTSSTSTKSMQPYFSDLDDLLEFLESDVNINQTTLNREHHPKLYDVAGLNKHKYIRPYLSGQDSNQDHEQNSPPVATHRPMQFDEYNTTRSEYRNGMPARVDSVPEHTRISIADAPKIIFDYQHKHYNFEMNGLTNVFAQQTMDTTFSNFENGKSSSVHPNSSTENSWTSYNRDSFRRCPPALNGNYSSGRDNITGRQASNQDTNNIGQNLNDTLQDDQAGDLNMYYTHNDTFDKDEMPLSVNSEPPNPDTHPQRGPYTETGQIHGNFLKTPGHSALFTAETPSESNGHTLHKETPENNNADSIHSYEPNYTNSKHDPSSANNVESPYLDLESQMRINELFGNLEDGKTNEPVFVSDASLPDYKETFSELYDSFAKSGTQVDKSLADVFIEKKEPASVPSKRKRDHNQEAFLGYLKCKNSFKKNLICDQFNLELSVNYWHQPVPVGEISRIYEPVLQRLLMEHNKMKLSMDESKQVLVEDCTNVPWPKQLERTGKHWDHVTRRILRNTTAAINFFSNVPGFNEMDLEDRKNILNTCTFTGANIVAAVHFYNKQEQKYKNFWNWTVPADNPMYPFKLKLLELGENINSLNITNMEAAVIVSLLLLSTDWCDLNDPVTMECERQKLIQALQAHLIDEGKDPVARIKELFYYMPKARFLSVWHKQLLATMKVNSKIQGVETLMSNCHV